MNIKEDDEEAGGQAAKVRGELREWLMLQGSENEDGELDNG